MEGAPAPSQGAEVRILNESDAEAYRALRPQPEGNFTVGAFLDGRLVGIASFIRYDRLKLRHRGHVGSVYVDEAARGQGIGRALLEALIARVRRYDGLEHLSLVVMSRQTAAQGLYRRLGFQTTCRERCTMRVGDTYLDQEQMVLWLEPPSQGDRSLRING